MNEKIEQLLKDFVAQGYSRDEILKAFKGLLDEQKITQEQYDYCVIKLSNPKQEENKSVEATIPQVSKKPEEETDEESKRRILKNYFNE